MIHIVKVAVGIDYKALERHATTIIAKEKANCERLPNQPTDPLATFKITLGNISNSAETDPPLMLPILIRF